MPTLEQTRLSALNAARYRKQNISQEIRGSLLASRKASQEDQEQEEPVESVYKRRLALLKAGAIKEANKQGGAYVGGAVGGFVGSAVPVVGTGIGAFIGRFVGKKLGITGIIIMAILLIFAQILFYIVLLKGACENTWTPIQSGIGIAEICKALGS